MSYRVVSVGKPSDPGDVRDESVERLAFALAIFGAEATLRHVGGDGSVTLHGPDGLLMSYADDRLAIGNAALD